LSIINHQVTNEIITEFFRKFDLETSILPVEKSTATHPYLLQQNNAFEPITELMYVAIINAWFSTQNYAAMCTAAD